MIRTLCAAVVAGLLAAGAAHAGKFNKVLSVGDAAPAFADLPGVDGKTYSLDGFKGKDVVVVVFTCNHCPVAIDYEERIVAFTKKYAGADAKVGIVAICVSDLEDDNFEAMKTHAKKQNFNFPYVFDESQKSGRAYGASKTPEFFVLNKDRKVVYMVSLDDSQTKPTTDYLSQAVEATLKGEKVSTAETPALGCGISYKKVK